EEPRKLLGVFGEHDVPVPEASDVFEKARVGVGRLSQPDHAGGDSRLLELGQEFLVITRFFAVVGIRKEDDVLGGLVGIHQLLAGGNERFVDEDAASLALNALHFAGDGLRVFYRDQFLDHVGGTVDGDHRHAVSRREHADGLGGAQVRQVHFGASS